MGCRGLLRQPGLITLYSICLLFSSNTAIVCNIAASMLAGVIFSASEIFMMRIDVSSPRTAFSAIWCGENSSWTVTIQSPTTPGIVPPHSCTFSTNVAKYIWENAMYFAEFFSAAITAITSDIPCCSSAIVISGVSADKKVIAAITVTAIFPIVFISFPPVLSCFLFANKCINANNYNTEN